MAFKPVQATMAECQMAEHDIVDWFRKHPDSDVDMRDIQFFAVPYLRASDCAFCVHRLVRAGVLTRHPHVVNPFTQTASYSLKR